MVDYTYMGNTGRLKEFIQGIPTRTLPEKVIQQYLEKIGFKSKNDRPITSVLKFIGFLDDKGTPTKNFADYRDTTKQRATMTRCIRAAYSDLFGLYPDAYAKDNEALMNFFRTESGLGEATVQIMAATFKTLCELADFGTVGQAENVQPEQETAKIGAQTITRDSLAATTGMTINLNIQLVLPTTQDTGIYDAIFKSMRKNLLESDKSDD